MNTPGQIAISVTFEIEADSREEAVRIIRSVLDNRGLGEDSAVVRYWVTFEDRNRTEVRS